MNEPERKWWRLLHFLSFTLPFLLGCGCVHLPSRCHDVGRKPLPPALLEKLARSPEETVTAEVSETKARSAYRIKRVEMKVQTPQRGTNFSVVCEYYQTRKPHSPVIMLLPMAGGTYPIEHYFARRFVKRGFAVVLVHRRRFAHDSRLEEINPWIVASVQDCQRALDWIESQPELDAGRIALFGISLGGLKGTLLAAADHRIRAAALGLVGSDLPYILTHSAEPKVTRQRKQLMQEGGKTREELEQELRGILEWDPADLAGYIDCENTLLVLGMFDTIVPFKKGWEMRHQLGGLETLLLPTGHYSAGLAIPYIQNRALYFFRKKMQVPWRELKGPRSPRDLEREATEKRGT